MLVIIGLVVSAVLFGADLVKAAHIRKTISSVEQLKLAVTTFQLKYNCIPGDCTNAESFWGSDASCPYTPTNTVAKQATCNGDGDGQLGIHVLNTSFTHVEEMYRFYQQLANAGFLAGQFTGVINSAPQGGAYWGNGHWPERPSNRRQATNYLPINAT